MKSNFFLIALLLVSLFQMGCKGDNPLPNEYTTTTIEYKAAPAGVDAKLVSLDIYHYNVNTENRPIIVYLHGGDWVRGDKADNLTNKLELFSSLGYLFISVNYRLSPDNNTLDPNRIMFPSANTDIADAIKWITDNIHIYNGNSQKMVIMGNNAGAHLAALSGLSTQFLPAKGVALSSIKGIACIDTDGYDVVSQASAGNTTYINAFGSDTINWVKASPILQVTSGTTYPRFFVAKRGTAAQQTMADEFVNELTANGVSVTTLNASDYDADALNNAIGQANETAVTTPLKTFLATCFQ